MTLFFLILFTKLIQELQQHDISVYNICSKIRVLYKYIRLDEAFGFNCYQKVRLKKKNPFTLHKNYIFMKDFVKLV